MDLARRLGVDPLSIEVHDMKPAFWDGCIGVYHAANLVCIQPGVAGHQVLFEHAGLLYRYNVGFERFVAMDWADDVVLDDGQSNPQFIDPGRLDRLYRFAKLDLAFRLGGNSGAVAVESIVPVTFADGCLGFAAQQPSPCGREPVPGAIVSLRLLANRYTYHVSLNGVVATDFVQGSLTTQSDPRMLDLQLRMREHLAMRTSVDIATVDVEDVRLVTWGDDCLGVKLPGADCTPGSIDGITVELQLHSGDGGPGFDPSYVGITWNYNGSNTEFVASLPTDERAITLSPTSYRDVD
jgi:hypothetical protein